MRYIGKLSAPWWAWLLLILGVSLFVRLGCWQWQRAEQKAQLLRHAKTASKQFSALYSVTEAKPQQGLTVKGQYDSKRLILLDNQFYQHTMGFDVLIPFKTTSAKWLFVDRGWVKAPAERKHLPEIPKLKTVIDIRGVAYYPSDKAWTLGASIENQGQWPLIVEKVDIQSLQAVLGVKHYPFVLRLDKAAPNALVRDWRLVTMSPTKHRAYAYQWFSFAMLAVIIFLILNVERKHASE